MRSINQWEEAVCLYPENDIVLYSIKIHARMVAYTGWPRKNATTLIVNLKTINFGIFGTARNVHFTASDDA